jgi:hypothetical protein
MAVIIYLGESLNNFVITIHGYGNGIKYYCDNHAQLMVMMSSTLNNTDHCPQNTTVLHLDYLPFCVYIKERYIQWCC